MLLEMQKEWVSVAIRTSSSWLCITSGGNSKSTEILWVKESKRWCSWMREERSSSKSSNQSTAHSILTTALSPGGTSDELTVKWPLESHRSTASWPLLCPREAPMLSSQASGFQKYTDVFSLAMLRVRCDLVQGHVPFFPQIWKLCCKSVVSLEHNKVFNAPLTSLASWI